MRIKTTFLQHASDIIGDTEKGMTGTQIVKFFNAKSVENDIDIPHISTPFDAPNKRTAIFDNLLKFTNEQQFEIISELCDYINTESTAKLKQQLFERYSERPSTNNKENSSKSNIETFDEFVTNKKGTDKMKHIPAFEEFTLQNSKTNEMKHVKKFDEFNNSTNKQWWKKPKYFVPLLAALIIGLFTLSSAIINKPFDFNFQNNDCAYKLVFIDKATDRTPKFTSRTPRVRIYIETPPIIERIIDGTVCIKTDKDLEKEQVLIELENIKNYKLVDRKQYIQKGVTEIFVNGINK